MTSVLKSWVRVLIAIGEGKTTVPELHEHLDLHENSIRKIAAKLERDGLVTGETKPVDVNQDSGMGTPIRRVLTLTAAGRKTLEESGVVR